MREIIDADGRLQAPEGSRVAKLVAELLLGGEGADVELHRVHAVEVRQRVALEAAPAGDVRDRAFVAEADVDIDLAGERVPFVVEEAAVVDEEVVGVARIERMVLRCRTIAVRLAMLIAQQARKSDV